jgi:methyltransferase
MVSRAYLVALVVERLVELVLSKRNAAIAFAQGGVEVGQLHYRVMTAFHTLFLVACAVEARAFDPVLFFAFLPGALAAQALRWWAIRTLGNRWNTRVIVVPGAAPVTGGPYRFMKHPNYLAVVIELFCVPMMMGAFFTAAVFTLGNAALLWVRIRAEEQALGPAWEQAFAGKSRLVPGAGARHG